MDSVTGTALYASFVRPEIVRSPPRFVREYASPTRYTPLAMEGGEARERGFDGRETRERGLDGRSHAS
jgi:hypothetical protein